MWPSFSNGWSLLLTCIYWISIWYNEVFYRGKLFYVFLFYDELCHKVVPFNYFVFYDELCHKVVPFNYFVWSFRNKMKT
jgi:hypothetical protein